MYLLLFISLSHDIITEVTGCILDMAHCAIVQSPVPAREFNAWIIVQEVNRIFFFNIA